MVVSPFRLLVPVLGLFVLSAAPALSEPLTVDGSGVSRDIHCAGDTVEIHGANHTIRLTGTCASVVVGGLEHTITIEQAGKLEVSGSGHKIAGAATGLVLDGDKSAVAVTLAGKEAEAAVAIAGGEHTVDLTLQGATRLEVQGVEQQVTWTLAAGTPEPKVSISGADNKVERKG